jgi:hypothetical protein
MRDPGRCIALLPGKLLVIKKHKLNTSVLSDARRCRALIVMGRVVVLTSNDPSRSLARCQQQKLATRSRTTIHNSFRSQQVPPGDHARHRD